MINAKRLNNLNGSTKKKKKKKKKKIHRRAREGDASVAALIAPTTFLLCRANSWLSPRPPTPLMIEAGALEHLGAAVAGQRARASQRPRA
jgi:hypothetical protein